MKVADASGVGPVTALAMVLTSGAGGAVSSGKEVGSYFEIDSQRVAPVAASVLGHISKQGSSFLRFLLVEAGQTAARYDAAGPFYRRLAVRKHRALAKVAVARKLAVRLGSLMFVITDVRATVQGGRRSFRVILWSNRQNRPL